jgi:hypothetical protein
LTLLLTFATKAVLYSLVAYLGVRKFCPGHTRPGLLTIGAVLVRIILGITFAIPMWMLGSLILKATLPIRSEFYALTVYIFLYGSFRWLAWSLTAMFAFPPLRSVRGFAFGSNGPDRTWRVTGVLASFASDVPAMLTIGGPLVGKFFC